MRSGLADDPDVRFGLQQVTDTPADDLVVIEEKDGDRLPGLVPDAEPFAGSVTV